MVTQRKKSLSVEDFLALDRESLDQKYEYRNGHMVAMAGGTTNHAMFISNTHTVLANHLKDPYFAFSEMTLKIEETCLLPDLMVTCNEEDLAENKTYIKFPCIVIEVLSPRTEVDDRREKFLHYINCPTMQEYVLINYDVMLVQTYTRKGMNWIYAGFMQGDNVELNTIGLTVAIEKIYHRVTLPPFDRLRGYKRKRKRLYE